MIIIVSHKWDDKQFATINKWLTAFFPFEDKQKALQVAEELHNSTEKLNDVVSKINIP